MFNTIKVNNTDTGYTHSIFDISEYHSGATYNDLSAALAAIPESRQHGGMTVCYETDGNKYMQYRLMSDTFNTTVANWQGIDDAPLVDSKNLVSSDGIARELGAESNYYEETTLGQNNGAPGYNADGCASIFIPVTAGATLVFKYGVVGVANTWLNVYKSDKTMISWASGGRILPTAGATETTTTLVENAAYIRVTFLAANKDKTEILLNGVSIYKPVTGAWGVNQTLDVIGSSSAKSHIEKINDITWTSGYALGLDGKTTAYEYFSVSQFIPVIEGDFYVVYLSRKYNTYFSADLPYLLLCGYGTAAESSFVEDAFPVANPVGCAIRIPKGVRYIRVCGDLTLASVLNNLFTRQGVYHYVYDYPNDKDIILPQSHAYTTAITVVTVNEKKFINYRVATYPVYGSYAFMQVEKGERFNVDASTFENHWTDVNVYDADLNIVSRTKTYGEKSVDITIPAGGKYLVINYLNGILYNDSYGNDYIENPWVKKFIDEVEYDDNDYSYSLIDNYTLAINWEINNLYTTHGDRPNPYHLEWTPRSDAASQKIVLSNEFGSRTIVLGATTSSYDVYNTIPNHTDLVKIVSVDSNNVETVIISKKISMNGKVRMIWIDGMINVRDTGGWKTLDGKTVKYGRIYRSAEPLNVGTPALGNITADGITELINRLGVGMELDFGGYSSESPLEDYLDFVHGDDYQIGPGYVEIFTEEGGARYKNSFVAVLSALRSGTNVIHHCTWGADRTGTFTFLLNGILGVSESDLAKDYELTNFVISGKIRTAVSGDANNFAGFVATIKSNYQGSNFQEKMKNFALSLGITQAEIEEFRTIMLE